MLLGSYELLVSLLYIEFEKGLSRLRKSRRCQYVCVSMCVRVVVISSNFNL